MTVQEMKAEAGAIAELLYDAIRRMNKLSAHVNISDDALDDLKCVKNYMLDVKERIK